MPTTQVRQDVLVQPIEAMEHALEMGYPGREGEWSEAVIAGFVNVGQALRLHAAAVEGPDGLFAKVDLTRPTLGRRVNQLRRDHRELQQRTRDLQERLQLAAQAFQPDPDTLDRALPSPVPAGPLAVADFGAIRNDIMQLLTDLRHHLDEEAKLILDSVNTDIGVGD